MTSGSRPSLVRSGGWPFLLTGAIGRMPAAMLQLGLLMYVTRSGLGIGLGGLTVAAVGLGTAAGASVVGRAADRFGPVRVVALAMVIQSVGLLGLMAVTTWVPSPIAILALAGVIGAANPQVGPIARAHWSTLARRSGQPDLIRHALGYEGACDETSFVVGPVAASLLVGLLGPNPALWVLLVFLWVGEGLFLAFLASRGRAEREAAGKVAVAPESGSADDLRWRWVVWPLLACGSVGMVFGSTQTTVTAVNEAAGTPAMSGIVYGCMGVGSALMSMLVVRIATGLAVKIMAGGLVIAAGELSMRMFGGTVPHAVACFTIGLGVGAVLVSGFACVERLAPASRINYAMTLAMTALTLGISVGSAASGQLAAMDPPDGFWLGVSAGVIAIIAGVSVARLAPERRLRM